MNGCAGTIFIEGESATCTKVLDHTGKHETTVYVMVYGEVIVKWAQ